MRYAVLPLLLVLEIGVFAPLSGVRFDTWSHFTESVVFYAHDLFVEATPLLVLVPGMTIVLMTAGIDLSVGSMVALVAAVMATFEPTPAFWVTAVPLGLLLATGLGTFNGLLIARLDIPPIVATLGTLFFYRGLCQVVLGSQERGPFHQVAGYEACGGWMASLALAAIILGCGGWYFHRSRWRREILMMGGNRIAARYAGIPVSLRTVQVYALMGFLCFPAAISFTARNGSVIASSLTGFELEVILAAVLGGTRVSGGYGSMTGSIFGVLLVVVLREGLRGAGGNVWITQTLPFGVNHLTDVLIGALLAGGVWLNTHMPASGPPRKAG